MALGEALGEALVVVGGFWVAVAVVLVAWVGLELVVVAWGGVVADMAVVQWQLVIPL